MQKANQNQSKLLVPAAGGFIGASFTMASHPFHVLYTRHSRYVSDQKVRPTLRSSLAYSANLIKTEGLRALSKGIGLRTFQGAASYALLYALKREFSECFSDDKPVSTSREIQIAASAGAVENSVCRQVLLTATTAKINGDNLLSGSMWRNTVCRLPLTSFFRSANFTASIIGRNLGSDFGSALNLDHRSRTGLSALGGTLCSVPFMGFAEVLTQATARGLPLVNCLQEATAGALRAPRDPNMVFREGFFLVPFIFSESLQSMLLPKMQLGLDSASSVMTAIREVPTEFAEFDQGNQLSVPPLITLSPVLAGLLK